VLLRRPHPPQIVIQDGVATPITGRLKALQDDDSRSLQVLLKQISDQRLEGIELARAGTGGRQRHRSPEVLFHGARGQMEMAGNATHRPVLASGEPVNFIDLVRRNFLFFAERIFC